MDTNVESMRQSILAQTDKLIKDHGPRLAGSKAAKDTADVLYRDLKQVADQTHTQKFVFHKGAFLGWIRWCVALYLIATIFIYLEAPLISTILMVIGLGVFYLQFLKYSPFMDKLYPPREGTNVIAYLEPSQKVRQQVIISGHHDSARIFNFLNFMPSLYSVRTTMGIVSLVLLFIVSLLNSLNVLAVEAWLLALIVFGMGILFVLPMWFFASKKGTPGAGDNLASSLTAATVFKYFAAQKKEGNGLESTRLIFASFDAEEEGLRGSRAYAEAYAGEFLLAPTYNINLECLFDSSALTLLKTDINGSVKLSEKLAQNIQTYAKQYKVPIDIKRIGFLAGGTDAAELAKRGVQATTLIGMPFTNHMRASVYHTVRDTTEAVSPQAVDNTLTVLTEWLKEIDHEKILK